MVKCVNFDDEKNIDEVDIEYHLNFILLYKGQIKYDSDEYYVIADITPNSVMLGYMSIGDISENTDNIKIFRKREKELK